MIKKSERIAFLIVLSITGIPTLCHATDNTAAKASFQFLEAATSPRNIAMGNTGAALPGTGFCHYNPAQPFFSNDPSLSIGYSPLPADLNAVFAEGFWNTPDMFFGLHLSNYSISGIIPSTSQGTNENAQFSSGFSLISFDAGLRRERFSVALAICGMQDRIGISTGYGVSISAGAAYKVIPGKFSMGLGLLNEGEATGYTDETQNWGDGDPMPRSARLGFAFCDTIKHVPIIAACDVVYRDVGDKVHSTKDIAPRMSLPLGIEVWPTDYVALRLGKRINFETEVINFGAGLKFLQLAFDMSFVIANLSKDIEVKPAFGLTFTPSVKNPAKKTVVKMPPAEVKPLQPPVQEIQPVDMKPNTPVAPIAPAASDSLSNKPFPGSLEKIESDTTEAPEEEE
jgi:hypothetical protein